MSKKIIDNPSYADLLKQLQAFESMEALYEALPFARKLFPKLEQIFTDFSEIKKQAEIIEIPDQFNGRFAKLGWIAYESMNMDIMREAISIYDSDGKNAAETYLTNSYDEKYLDWGIRLFKGNTEFRRRIRLAKLAKTDFLSGRYHACIPLLLSMLDGLVNDVSKHVGFFAQSTDLTAWDCIAAHETGLQSLSSLMTKGRNKTNEDSIDIPYRHGILHGRELAFDNKLVAAKSWAALFAARDWAVAITDGKKNPKSKQKVSWKELIQQITENGRQKKLLEAWKPRSDNELKHIPFSGPANELPKGTPELAVAEFIENWCSRRYGLIAESLLYFTNTPAGKKAGIARGDFSKNIPISYKVLSIEDQAAAASHVIVKLTFQIEDEQIHKEASIRAIYQDEQNNSMIRTEKNGRWKIVQNSFSEILYIDL